MGLLKDSNSWQKVRKCLRHHKTSKQMAISWQEFAIQLSSLVPYDALVAIFLGFASAVVDNVPLVAAAQGMYDLGAHPANDGLWNLITYCAATGGSLLVIGSAAGVAFMGMERNVSFGWYVKSIGPAALAGYFLGVAGILLQQTLGLSVA